MAGRPYYPHSDPPRDALLKERIKRLVPTGVWRRLHESRSALDRWRWESRPFRRSFGLVRGAALHRALTRGRAEVAVRLPGYAHPLHLRAGTSDVSAFVQVFCDGEYDFSTERPPTAVLDGGANVGCAAVYFAHRWPAARIVAVEPDRQNFDLLVRNVAGYPTVTPLLAALWSHPTRLQIEDPDDEPWALRVVEGDGTVEGITVEAAAQAAGLDGFDLVKLDIEGAEIEVLATSPAWLGPVQTLVIEPHEWLRPGCDAALRAALAGGEFAESTSGENVVAVRRPAP